MGFIVNLLLEANPLQQIVDWGIFQLLKAAAAVLRQLVWSVAVLVNRDADPDKIEPWMNDVLYGTALDEDDVEQELE